jgi:hypothetical protein
MRGVAQLQIGLLEKHVRGAQRIPKQRQRKEKHFHHASDYRGWPFQIREAAP